LGDIAEIGVPNDKWGETVITIVVLVSVLTESTPDDVALQEIMP